MEFKLYVLAFFFLASTRLAIAKNATYGEFFCNGFKGGAPSNASSVQVKDSFRKLISNINTSASYQDGVSFTGSINHTDGSTIVTRLMYWDKTRCAPGTDIIKNFTTVIQTFKKLFESMDHKVSFRYSWFGYSWGTMISESFFLDYYTVNYVVNITRYMEPQLPCKGLKGGCNPKVSNLISGTNGVFNVLRTKERLVSPNKVYYLEMQDDCNLVLYKNQSHYFSNSSSSIALWSSKTNGKGENCSTILRKDLNLVVISTKPGPKKGTKVLFQSYPSSKLARNSTHLLSNPATGVLTMQNDGNLVLYATDLVVNPIWATDTYGKVY